MLINYGRVSCQVTRLILKFWYETIIVRILLNDSVKLIYIDSVLSLIFNNSINNK